MKSTRMRRAAAALLCFVLTISLLAVSGSAFAKAKRTVRVAFFPMEGYHEKLADGTLGGMDVKYLDALSRYTDWNVEFIECSSWDDALEKLSSHEVDLVGSAQYSAARAETFHYASLSSGYTFGIIAANPDSTLAYEDFDAMRDITFGMVKTYVRRTEFLQYLADNGISSPKLREYDTTSQLQEALNNGEVDAMVHTFMEIREGQRLIGRFAPRPIYYITYPGNDDVLRELEQAVADMKMNEPELESKLMNEFYQSRLDKTIVFSTSEKEYAAEKKQINVGYLDIHYPFLYVDDSGECCGLTRDILENAAAIAGLTLSWTNVDAKYAHQALSSGEIDLLSYCTHSAENLGESDLTRLRDYAQTPLVVVMPKNKELNALKTLATVEYLTTAGEGVIAPEKTIIYTTQPECIEALKEGEADAVLCDGYLAEYLLSSRMEYYNLEVRRVLNQERGIAMAVRLEDTLLAGILDKTVLSIDDRAVSDYMMESNIYSMTSVGRFVQDHSITIIAILLVVILIIAIVAVLMINNGRKIQQLMYKDIDTDIWNLNHLLYRGKKIIDSDRKLHFAVAYLNIYHFQRYKVVYGWDSGQHLITSIAHVLGQCVSGKSEICAKADGDHFALLLSDEAGDITERLRNIGALIEEFIFRDTGNRVDIQLGVYFLQPDSDDLRGALVCATQAIDFIHGERGERIKVFDETLEQAIRERHEKQRLLDSMDINQNFTAYYQAKVDVRTEKIVGAEALVRFMDPTASGAVISPGFFVPYYEKTGRVTEIDFFVLECVCAMLRRRMDQGEAVVTVSCNFSRIHFTKPDFVDHLTGVLDNYGIPRELIEVEVTETLVMEELQQKIAEQTMEDLHTRGIRLSIDDFGSGYSSLGIFEKIPASVIKLDRSFLLNKEDRSRQVTIMKSIVDLAEGLNAQIVCEGVETEEDVELMREIGAHVAQGYRYARPVPEDEFEARLSREAQPVVIPV